MNGRPKTESKADPRRNAPLGPTDPNHVTQEELAQIGEGEVAYLKLMMSEEIRRAFPQAPDLAPGLKLFACSRPTARRSCWRIPRRRPSPTPGSTSSRR